jgi:hypothetical protein
MRRAVLPAADVARSFGINRNKGYEIKFRNQGIGNLANEISVLALLQARAAKAMSRAEAAAATACPTSSARVGANLSTLVSTRVSTHLSTLPH